MCQLEGRNWQTEFKKQKVIQPHTAYKKFTSNSMAQVGWKGKDKTEMRYFIYKKGFTYIHNLVYVLKCYRRLHVYIYKQ